MEYDRYRGAVLVAYEAYAGKLTSEYLAAQAAGRGLEAVGALRATGLAALRALVQQVRALTDDYLAALDHGAGVDERSVFWLADLERIATKNLNDLLVRLMGGGLRVADLLHEKAGAIGLLLQKKMGVPRLTARDGAGRAWQSDQLVAVMARDFAYQAYLDATIERLDADGVELVDIAYPDPGHANHGLTIRLDEVALVRRTLFHPNSTARLVPHVPT